MGKFDVEENISNIRRMMLIMGTWPKDSTSIPYKVLGFSTIFILTSFTATTVIQALRFEDIESTSFALCVAMASFHTMIKYFFLYTKKEQLFDLMKMLKKPVLSLHDDHLITILTKKMRMCKFSQYVLILAATGTGMLIIVSPLLVPKTERPVPVPFPMDMRKQSFIVYILVWWFQCSGVLLTCISVGCFDGLIFFFIATAAAELEILRERIMEATNNQATDIQAVQIRDNFDNVINRLLKDCVILHTAIERYIKAIQTTFTNAFLIQLLISLLITCLLGLTIILIPIYSIDFGMGILFFVASSTELVFFCVPGNEIILQSEKVRDACYMSHWANCGPSVRKSLFIIMERTKRPFQLSAANFVVLSLDTLISVFKSALSYFTVLQQIYGNSKKI